MKFTNLLLFVLIITSACKNEPQKENVAQLNEADIIKKATEIHQRVLTVDTHNDINVKNFTDTLNYTQELDNQVNLPKMKKGGLDVSWFIVYTGQGPLTDEGFDSAYEEAIRKFDAIHKLTTEIAPEEIQLATTAEAAIKINSEGKKVAMIGIENGYPVGKEVSRVKEFYDLGARYMSLSHNGHSQLCDSNTGEEDGVWLHDGVSDLGKEVIIEMNKWGMMIDVSHPSKESMRDMIELSKAPIIASHSSARALCNHSRNLDDEQLAWMKENGGVVQTVAFSSYVNTEKSQKFREASKKVMEEIAETQGVELISWKEYGQLDKEAKEVYLEKYMEVVKLAKPKQAEIEKVAERVDVADFVDHIDYLVEKIGIDHVGISSDFDGGGGVKGWDDASETLNVTIELVRRGYTEDQIEKLWGANLFRVLNEVQEVAWKIQNS